VCVKTAAIMSAVIALGPLAEEDYMRLVKGMVEPKDRLVLKAGVNTTGLVTASPRPSSTIGERSSLLSGRARCW
jgi:hypothetical protein